jgi:glycosyltransferase involved in cell wall biosynthesis
VARGGFRRVAPWLDERTVGRLTRAKRWAASAARQNPGKLAFTLARDGYRNHVRRWLSQEALGRVSAAKKSALAMVGREPTVVPDPPLPSSALTLGGGLTYLTIFNVGDRRKNYRDILTAFLSAFRDRADATLVVKLVTNRWREHHEAGVLREAYRSFGMGHRCRVAVITEFLTEEQMTDLFRVTTFYVNASHAEGACLPLMRALAGGRPSIAPDHTAMADYVDASLAFVPGSSLEPTYWPHEPEQRLETSRYRLSWSDLRAAFLSSASAADRDPALYSSMSRAARSRISSYASLDASEQALRSALDLLREPPAFRAG